PPTGSARSVRSCDGRTCVLVMYSCAPGHGASRISNVPCTFARRAAAAACSIGTEALENCATEAPPGEKPVGLFCPVLDSIALNTLPPQKAVHGRALTRKNRKTTENQTATQECRSRSST